MRLKLRFSLLTLLVIIAACAVGLWLTRAWLYPNRVAGQRFALIGPIDIDRDGRDDRDRLKLMIFRNGGTVDFDMPVGRPARGSMGSRTTWYVTDDRIPGTRLLPATFLEVQSRIIKQARQDGIRPMPIERLLYWLNGR